MDRSAALAVLDRELHPMMAALGVAHWTVQVRLAPLEADGGDEFRTRADARMEPDYSQALIRIDHDQAASAARLRDALRHELIHLILAPWQVYRDLVAQHVDPETPAGGALRRAYTFALEQSVLGIERALDARPARRSK